MQKIFIFPGQGSQILGMGQDIYNNYNSAKTVFDKDSLTEITDFFNSKSDNSGKLSYENFVGWSDIKEMMKESMLTDKKMETVWAEAAKGNSLIDYDSFLRLNIKLDLSHLEILR